MRRLSARGGDRMSSSQVGRWVERCWEGNVEGVLHPLDLETEWESTGSEIDEEDLVRIADALVGLGPPLIHHLQLHEEAASHPQDAMESPPPDGKTARRAARTVGEMTAGTLGVHTLTPLAKGSLHDVGHRNLSKILFGREYAGVHRLMDRAAGASHRWIGHSLQDVLKVGKRFAGRGGRFNTRAASAALQHLSQDFFTKRGIPLVSKKTAERLSQTCLFQALQKNTAAKVSQFLALNFARSLSMVLWAWTCYDVYCLCRDIRTQKVLGAAMQQVASGQLDEAWQRLDEATWVRRGWNWHHARGYVAMHLALAAMHTGASRRAVQHASEAMTAFTDAWRMCRPRDEVTLADEESDDASSRLALSARGVVGRDMLMCHGLSALLAPCGSLQAPAAEQAEVADAFVSAAERHWKRFWGARIPSAIQNHLQAAELYLTATNVDYASALEYLTDCRDRLLQEAQLEDYCTGVESQGCVPWTADSARLDALVHLMRLPLATVDQNGTWSACSTLDCAVRSLKQLPVGCATELQAWQKLVNIVVVRACQAIAEWEQGHRVQCAAMTASGEQCRRSAQADTSFCWQHNGRQSCPGQCRARTAGGKQCRRPVGPDAAFCWQHGVQRDAADADVPHPVDSDITSTSLDGLSCVLSALPLHARCNRTCNGRDLWRISAAQALLSAATLAASQRSVAELWEKAARLLMQAGEPLAAYWAYEGAAALAVAPHLRRKVSERACACLDVAAEIPDNGATVRDVADRAELAWLRAHAQTFAALRTCDEDHIGTGARQLLAIAKRLAGREHCVMSRGADGVLGTGFDASMVAALQALSCALSVKGRRGRRLRSEVLTTMQELLRENHLHRPA